MTIPWSQRRRERRPTWDHAKILTPGVRRYLR